LFFASGFSSFSPRSHPIWSPPRRFRPAPPSDRSTSVSTPRHRLPVGGGHADRRLAALAPSLTSIAPLRFLVWGSISLAAGFLDLGKF
jgi:hypothetical protein